MSSPYSVGDRVTSTRLIQYGKTIGAIRKGWKGTVTKVGHTSNSVLVRWDGHSDIYCCKHDDIERLYGQRIGHDSRLHEGVGDGE